MRLAKGFSGTAGVTILALLATGCTGSNLLPTGNAGLEVEFELVGVENTTVPYECINLGFEGFNVRPLDGNCSEDAANSGAPCLDGTDCDGGTCLGSTTAPLLGGNGIAVVPGIGFPAFTGNMLGTDCEISNRCLLTGTPCVTMADCDQSGGSNSCNPVLSGFEAIPFMNPLPIVLSEGLYEVNKLFLRFSMWDDDAPGFIGCESDVDYAVQYGDALNFYMPEQGTKRLRFRLDAAALEAALMTPTCSPELIPQVMPCLDCDGAP